MRKPYRIKLLFPAHETYIYSDVYSEVLLHFLVCRKKKISASIEQYVGGRNHVPDYAPIAKYYTDV